MGQSKSMVKLAKELIKTPVLVVGAGLAGSMAAIRASELLDPGKVLVVEKSHVRRSGNAATGVDHTWSYMPEIHRPSGYTIEQLVQDHLTAMGELQDEDILFTIASTIADRIKDMERWGFPFKTGGEYNYVKKIHSTPTFLHWAGRDHKVLFARELERRGVRVLNRVMVTDLVTQNGQVAGAIGVGIREPKVFAFDTKTIVVAAGGIARLFPGPTSWEFNRGSYPYGTGDGVAMAYRAGAEVAGLEFLYRHTGPKNFCKKGRGTWIGVVEDTRGNPIGRVRKVADRKKIDISVESPGDMIKAYRQGNGPVLMNCAGISKEDWRYMNWGLMNEGNTVLLHHMKERGIDPRHVKVEFGAYELEVRGGLVIDVKAQTNVKGLFAAGDVVGNIKRGSSPGAFAMGWIAGEGAARCAEGEGGKDRRRVFAFVKDRKAQYEKMLSRKELASWKEALAACQDIMAYYAGEWRYETLLKAGLIQIRMLKERASDALMAKDTHELMRCLEALNLMDIGEAAILATMQRKETRSTMRESFVRVDYPKSDAAMNKFLIIKLQQGKPDAYWREPRRISR
jgi:succinate dehydrogenase/fumarate reductase flavoprotein subunit